MIRAIELEAKAVRLKLDKIQNEVDLIKKQVDRLQSLLLELKKEAWLHWGVES